MSLFVFVFKQKTAYEMRISDWSSDVCSSDLVETNSEDHSWPHHARILVVKVKDVWCGVEFLANTMSGKVCDDIEPQLHCKWSRELIHSIREDRKSVV